MLIDALLYFVIPVFIIKAFAGKDVSFGDAFFAALVAGIGGGALAAPALVFLENPVVAVAVFAGVQFVVAVVVVRFVCCSIDLKRVLMIAGTYTVVVVGLYNLYMLTLPPLSRGVP